MTTVDNKLDPLHGLVMGMVNHNERSLEALYTATFQQMYSLAIRITQRREYAEEVIADTYWQAWLEAARFDAEKGPVIAWLLTICRSRALDMIRRLKGHQQNELAMDQDAEFESDNIGPMDLLLEVEQSSLLHDALAELKPIERQMIALAFFKGLTHTELSEQLRIPLGSVKTTIRRAQAALRSKLG